MEYFWLTNESKERRCKVMAINNPPLTDNSTLNMVLLEVVREVNLIEQRQLKLLADIRAASNFADLKIRIDQR